MELIYPNFLFHRFLVLQIYYYYHSYFMCISFSRGGGDNLLLKYRFYLYYIIYDHKLHIVTMILTADSQYFIYNM
jgi:hypothetical protein